MADPTTESIESASAITDDGSPRAPTPQPRFGSNGVPLCSGSACLAFDGKRCELLGRRPDNICEPSVEALVHVAKSRAVPHADTVDALRYRRLQILGAFIPELQRDIPGLSELVGVKRFSNLDAILDADMRVHPSRGEARLSADPRDEDIEKRFQAFSDKVTEEVRVFSTAAGAGVYLERPPAVLVVEPPVRGVIAVLVLHEDTGPGRYKITLNLGGGVQHSFSRLNEAEARVLLKKLALSHVPLPVPSETMKNAWAAAEDGVSS